MAKTKTKALAVTKEAARAARQLAALETEAVRVNGEELVRRSVRFDFSPGHCEAEILSGTLAVTWRD